VKVTRDVRLSEGTLEGTVSVGGQLSATTARYRGMLEVEGAVEVREKLSGTGSLLIGSTLHAGEADLKGSARAAGAVTVDRSLSVRGSFSAPSLTTGLLELAGDARIPGETSAGAVSARLGGDSSFGTIRARSVALRVKVPNLVEKVLGRRITVTVVRVEAESAELEAVDVKFVRSPRITLGRHAHVTEYEGTIVRRHPTSRVGFESKSPPPYGLTR
jgi:cytoskeletal protein CcmA (bactofilin family)